MSFVETAVIIPRLRRSELARKSARHPLVMI
jgi:hypothetical protein